MSDSIEKVSREACVRSESLLPRNLEKLVLYGGIGPSWLKDQESFLYLTQGRTVSVSCGWVRSAGLFQAAFAGKRAAINPANIPPQKFDLS